MAYEFSDNIQRGIIYLLKSDRNFFAQILGLVKSDYFEFDVHAKIFEAVIWHYDQYETLPTDDFILERVKTTKKGRDPISDYEDELIHINKLDVTSLNDTDAYLDLIETFAKREAIKHAIARSISHIKEGNEGKIEEEVRKALTINRNVDSGQDYFSNVDDRWNRILNTEDFFRYSTVLPSLDKTLEGGLGPKELAMIVALPGVGKSVWLVNQAVAALKQDLNVLYVSLEMSEDRIGQRVDSVMTLIPQASLGTMRTELERRHTLFKDKFSKGRLIIKEFAPRRASANTIRALLSQLEVHEEFKPDLIIIDYLELLLPVHEINQEHLAQQRVAEELRGIAVENNVLLWTATQANREGAKVKLITEAELADSFGKVRVCDACISLNQTMEEFDEGKMRAYIIKSRNGRAKFTVNMEMNYNTLQMREVQNDELAE